MINNTLPQGTSQLEEERYPTTYHFPDVNRGRYTKNKLKEGYMYLVYVYFVQKCHPTGLFLTLYAHFTRFLLVVNLCATAE